MGRFEKTTVLAFMVLINSFNTKFSIGNRPTIIILRHYTSQFVFLKTVLEHIIYGPIGFDETVFILEVN